jgi:anti-anti-sigma factor
MATRQHEDATVIVVAGEVDAANAVVVADCAAPLIRSGARLVFDLSRVEFLGSEGFVALEQLAARCAVADAHQVVVASPAVARLLRICDSAGALTTAGTVDAAFAVLRGHPRLSLVPSAR